MQNVAILLEHVDLLDTGNGLNTNLLQSGLELGGIALQGRDGLFDLFTTGGTLSACEELAFRAARYGVMARVRGHARVD